MSSNANKTGSWYLLEVRFKISDDYPRPFYEGFFSPLPLSAGTDAAFHHWKGRELLMGECIVIS